MLLPCIYTYKSSCCQYSCKYCHLPDCIYVYRWNQTFDKYRRDYVVCCQLRHRLSEQFDWRRLARSLSHSVIYSANCNCLHLKRNIRHILITTKNFGCYLRSLLPEKLICFLSLFYVLYMRLHFSGLKEDI